MCSNATNCGLFQFYRKREREREQIWVEIEREVHEERQKRKGALYRDTQRGQKECK